MRKFITATLTVIASLLFVMTAFAANTWTQKDNKWYCMDKDGNLIYGEMQKSGDGWYYLDEGTGEMVMNRLVEIDGKKYWFGEDGAKVVDKWVKVPVENDDDGWEWMYFSTVSGKAVVNDEAGKFTTINGKKYAFNNDGYMLYGYLDASFGKADNAVAATYYMGDKNDGSAQTGWIKFTDGSAGPGYDEKELVYFYFKNGKKIKADKDITSYKINGVKYYFNEDGSMYAGYQVASGSEVVATGTYYLGPDNDGVMKKNQWVKTSTIAGGDTEYWYYLGSDGRVVTAAADKVIIKKINNKRYLFDETGKMLTGVYALQTNGSFDSESMDGHKFTSLKELKDYELPVGAEWRIYYFSTDADNDGSMKTGAQKIVIDDEEATIYLSNHGEAYEGVKNKKVYNNGIMLTGVGVVKCHADKQYYLVNAAGTVLKNAYVTDEDGIRWATNEKLGIAKFVDQDYAAKAATAWKSGTMTFYAGKDYYSIVITDTGNGYYKASYVKSLN